MSKIATFKTKKGTKTWQVSSSGIMDLDGFSTSFELNAESNDAVEGSPRSNKRGKKQKVLSFSSRLIAALGIDVREEFESWEDWIGLAGTLKIGGKKFGPNWMLTSVKPSDVNIDNSGRFISMKLTYSFEEDGYVSDTQTLENVNASNSAADVTATTEQKETKKTTNTAITTAAKTAAPSTGFGLGAIVKFNGGPQYASSTAESFQQRHKAGPVKVTATAKSAPHPYRVIHTDKTTTVDGWVDASQLSKLPIQPKVAPTTARIMMTQ